ncbi:translation initiation factor IF-2 [Anguilla rostrata]|uniref:translation initiation factor IF-2 n=1 Tax=Anguilla rostrata TaxID=7938 RepID=UPI0030CC335A
MSEKHLKLKLKRKKAAIQVDKCEQNSSIVVKKSTGVPIPFSSFESDLRSEATEDPYDSKPGEWWDRPDLQAVEKLWAVTLKSATAYAGHSVWETVPDLPPASPLTRSVEEESGWRWCSLSEEVGPLPSPPKPTVGSSPVLDARGPSAQLRPADSGPVSEGAATLPNPAPQKGRLSSAPAEEEAAEGTHTRNPGPLAHQPQNRTGWQAQSPPSSRKVPAAGGAGRGGGAREENRAAGGTSLAGAEGGGIKRRLPARAGGGSDSHAPEERHGRAGPPQGDGDVSGKAHTHRPSAGAAAAAATMENCPMCLLPFPSGFTQMECDSHLAKCLSEMNDDMTW